MSRTQTDKEQFGNNNIILLKMDRRTFNLWRDDKDTDQPLENRSVVIGFNPMIRGLNLSALTEQELNAFEHFINECIAIARPKVQELDHRASQAKTTGDYSYKRIWRIAPQFIDFRTMPPIQPEPEGTTNAKQHESL